jgi:hypothetical protein
MAFLLFAVVTLGMLVPFTLACWDFIEQSNRNKPDGYEFPKFSDFKITLASSVVFCFLEVAV